ncbi:hypothetical protein [Sporosarcina sp. ITBMC105]
MQAINPGETYLIDGKAHKVITAVASMGRTHTGRIALSEPKFILEDIATGERLCIAESVLRARLKEETE